LVSEQVYLGYSQYSGVINLAKIGDEQGYQEMDENTKLFFPLNSLRE